MCASLGAGVRVVRFPAILTPLPRGARRCRRRDDANGADIPLERSVRHSESLTAFLATETQAATQGRTEAHRAFCDRVRAVAPVAVCRPRQGRGQARGSTPGTGGRQQGQWRGAGRSCRRCRGRASARWGAGGSSITSPVSRSTVVAVLSVSIRSAGAGVTSGNTCLSWWTLGLDVAPRCPVLDTWAMSLATCDLLTPTTGAIGSTASYEAVETTSRWAVAGLTPTTGAIARVDMPAADNSRTGRGVGVDPLGGARC